VSEGELVLVIPRASIMADPGWYGLTTDGLDGFDALVARDGEFRPRAEMERDRSWKQVIPYLVLRDGPRYFLMRRTQAGGDARLHDRWTIGVGGHLNPGDGDLPAAASRVAEEVDADFEPPSTIGFPSTTRPTSAACTARVRGGRRRARRRDPRDGWLVGAFAEPAEVQPCRSNGDVERAGL
jgi:hypothetical protein